MKGKLYGIGVGPGDPDMMTLRAAALIRTADCICLPQSPKEKCRAYRIARQAVPELENRACVCFDFTMTRYEAELSKIHQGIYGEIRKLLTEGKPAAFLTIGDPAVYSTFGYIMEQALQDGFHVETVGGVTSFSTVAASLGISLCERDEELHIATGQSSLEDLLELPGTKVIMKCGKSISGIKAVLQRAEKEKKVRVYAVSNCGLPEEEKYYCADDIPETAGYMTTIIVKEPGRSAAEV